MLFVKHHFYVYSYMIHVCNVNYDVQHIDVSTPHGSSMQYFFLSYCRVMCGHAENNITKNTYNNGIIWEWYGDMYSIPSPSA